MRRELGFGMGSVRQAGPCFYRGWGVRNTPESTDSRARGGSFHTRSSPAQAQEVEDSADRWAKRVSGMGRGPSCQPNQRDGRRARPRDFGLGWPKREKGGREGEWASWLAGPAGKGAELGSDSKKQTEGKG
jgi:hypothetical protein